VSVAVLLAALAVVSAGTAAAAEVGLTRLRAVTVSVDVAHPLETMTTDDLTAHLGDALRRAEPPITVADSATDRIRLTVAVHPVSATTLRGFWLPFSGTYGVGALHLGVERIVTLPGQPRAFPAVVWQAHRAVGGPWRGTEREIARLIDEMVAELVAARR
jgi:hypothetical protein